jgi:periplasmic protein TonB
VVQASQDLSYRQQHPVRYPPQARRLHHQGTVMLKVLVGVDGSPKQVIIQQGSGYHELDRAAVRAAKRWKFNPATRNGVPMEGWALIPVQFKLGGY